MSKVKDKPQKIKVVVIGDGSVGKTCLLIRYVEGRFPHSYIPTIFDNTCVNINHGSTVYEANLYDTGSGEDYCRLRPVVYPDTDVLILCFAIDNRDSYENITSAWLPELNFYLPNTPVVLVGTKTDLEPKISYQEGQDLKKTIKANAYLECSARDGSGVKAVFGAVATAYTEGVKDETTEKKKCMIL